MKIVVMEPIHEEGIKILENYAKVSQINVDTPLKRIIEEIRDADAIISRGFIKISREIIYSAEKLKVIGVHGVGVDHIDLEAAREKGIEILNTPAALTETVAEYTLGLIISLLRKINLADEAVRMGRWNEKYSKLVGEDVEGKVIGIIGLGRIGSAVARMLSCLKTKIIYYDVERKKEIEEEFSLEYVDLDELLRRADIITIHVPLTKETYHLISKSEIEKMKNGVYLINTSRGAVIDEEALIDALRNGKIAGAALDVFETEPIDSENPLLNMENVILTPHIAASSRQALIRMAREVAIKVIEKLEERKFK
ncbi:MAG: hydroxyacid dehydrogenase [archaeon GB-1845-036]|nr:hydroxyacid dehydrogenase [Candidatus Culexmicrobium thermophilum]RLE53733.1 MAG: 3-phosphoglycerate dehydrogenase [Candidatus Verstraetearchaeota archaeon]HDO20119.1 hydroxyacid dehydrogenase [Candidatus Bathyarchaeota archaeon]